MPKLSQKCQTLFCHRPLTEYVQNATVWALMDKATLQKGLAALGLVEKEAKVYLAALEMGAASAQEIATRAVVNRPTTYIMLESLAKRGLVSEFVRGKRRAFRAAPPKKLQQIISDYRREVDSKENALTGILSGLETLAQNGPPTTAVRLFAADEAAAEIRQDFLATAPGETWELAAWDEVAGRPIRCLTELPAERQRELHLLCALPASAKLRAIGLPRGLTRRVTTDNGQAGVVVYGDKVALTSQNGQFAGIIIHDSGLAAVLRLMLQAMWKQGQEL